jgi:hypothetical protein
MVTSITTTTTAIIITITTTTTKDDLTSGKIISLLSSDYFCHKRFIS